MRRSWILAAAAWVSAAAAAEPTLDRIRECARANVPPSVRIQKLELTAFDRAGGSRSQVGRLFAKQDEGLLRLTLRLDAPADVAGSAYLLRERAQGREMYLYVPALNKVRRITGEGLGGRLFATDFSYADLSRIQQVFDADAAELSGSGSLEGRVVDHVTLLPRADEETPYDRIAASIDRETCLPVRIEFFVGDEPVKRYRAALDQLSRFEGRWYAALSEMADLKQGTHTRLAVQEIENGDALANRYFLSKSFYEGP